MQAAFTRSPCAGVAECSQSVLDPAHVADVRCSATELNGAPLASCSATLTSSTQGTAPFTDARCAVPGANTDACVQTFAPNGPGQWWVFVLDLVVLGQQRSPLAPPLC